MPQTLTPTLAAAALSSVRQPITQLLVWLAGDAGPSTDLSYMLAAPPEVDRVPQDTPEYVSRFAGSIASQVAVSLDWQGDSIPGGDGLYKSRDLAPYVGTIASLQSADFGLGAKVQIRTGFVTTLGRETVPAFTGRVDSVDVADDGSVILHCLDGIAQLLAQVSLPTAFVDKTSPRYTMPTYLLVEFLLRSGGMYLTPPPGDGCVLSVPGILPEIGTAADPISTASTDWGNPAYTNFGRYPAARATTDNYVSTANYAPVVGTVVIVEGWFRADPTISQTVVDISSSGTSGGMGFNIPSSGSLSWQAPLTGSPLTVSAGTWPGGDNGWHYVYAELTHTSGGCSWYTKIDSAAAQTGTSTTSLLTADNGSRLTTVLGTTREGVQVRYTTAAKIAASRPLNNAWAPTYAPMVLGTTPEINCVPPGQSGAVIDLIRGIATATGATFRITEAGVWRWEEQDSRVARRLAATTADYDDTRALNVSGYSYSSASRLSSVTIDWTQFGLQRSTATNPAYAESQVLIGPAATTTNIEITTPAPLIGILPPGQTSVGSASYSSFQAVAAYQVGDPAARIVSRITVQAVANPTGFTLTIANANSFDVALWDPATGNPALSLQGWILVGTNPLTYTSNASPRTLETLVVSPSPWRQTRAFATAMADQIAAEVSLPAIVFADQQIAVDPGLTVDDVVRIRAPQIMNSLIPCQLIGMKADDTVATITVRACYPPIGWVLDLTGRSELDATALLVA